MNNLIDKIFEVGYSGIVRKQKSINRLFPEFPDRVKQIGAKGGLRLKSQKPDEWFFKIHSGTKESVWYDAHLRFKNVRETLKKYVGDRRLWVKDKSRVDRRKLAKKMLYSLDMELSCSCPAQLYYGGDYILSLAKYNAKYGDKELRQPRIRNPKQYGMVCKHLQNLLNVLPFYETTMAKWLNKFYEKDIQEMEDVAKSEFGWAKAAGAALGKRKEDEEEYQPTKVRKPVSKPKSEPAVKKEPAVEPEPEEKEKPESEEEKSEIERPKKVAPKAKTIKKKTETEPGTPEELEDETPVDFHEPIPLPKPKDVQEPTPEEAEELSPDKKKKNTNIKKKKEPEEEVEESVVKEKNTFQISSYNSSAGIIKVLSSSGRDYRYKGVSPFLYNKVRTLIGRKQWGTAWQLLRNLKPMTEGVASARKTYLETKKVSKELFDMFIKGDPSRNKKYLEWMLQRYVEKPERPEHIVDVIKLYYELVEREKVHEKDINRIKTLEDLENIVNAGSQKQSKSEIKRDIKKDAIVVKNTDDLFIVNPLTYEASLLYGKGTKWCTAMTTNRSYWDLYRRKGVKFYYIHDKKKNKKYAVAMYLNGKKEVYTEEDKLIKYETLRKRLGI